MFALRTVKASEALYRMVLSVGMFLACSEELLSTTATARTSKVKERSILKGLITGSGNLERDLKGLQPRRATGWLVSIG